MIENAEYDPNILNNPRTKKQIQILLSRNAEDDKQLQKKFNSIETAKDRENCQSTYFDDKTSFGEESVVKDYRNTEAVVKNNDTDEKCGDKSRFEEIENKLEEMFAGIEDEHITTIPSEKGSNDIALFFNKEVESIGQISNMDKLPNNCYSQGDSASNISSLPTKGAMKSTVSCPKNASKEIEILNKKSQPFQPIRRLSIEINSELLKFPVKSSEKAKYKLKNVSNDVIKNNCRNSGKLGSQKSKATSKYKIKKNTRKSCIEYKRNTHNKKKPQKKGSINSITKHRFKQGRRLVSSDNEEEYEEKTQQSRETDNKNRSPFILVNPNGTVTVVNTLMQDEFNEKYTKTKISKSYVFERKTVKGCHSSTLSNRYDADKADSSWICVFCKKGPHKKGLGDLFGPYIISTDCDEYQSYKDLREFSQKNGKADLAFFTDISSNVSNIYNKTVKHLFDTSIKSRTYHALDMPKHVGSYSTPNYSLGMIKISECSYEVWIHEDCAIWAPNIFIIGSRLTGLEEAIWNSMGHECCYCSTSGALLCCLQRDCKIMAHLPCAREINWLLDELSHLTLCEKHFHSK